MKIKLKDQLVTALISGLVFAIMNSAVDLLLLDRAFSWGYFLYYLIFFGLFFEFGLPFLMNKQNQKVMNRTQIELTRDETVLCEGITKLSPGIRAVGGKLLLTDQRLVFMAFKKNSKDRQKQILLADIKEALPKNRLKLFKSEIRIINKAGEYFDFAIYERDKWIKKVNSLRTVI